MRSWPALADSPGRRVLGCPSWLVAFCGNQARVHRPSCDAEYCYAASSCRTDHRQAADNSGAYRTSRV